MIMWVAVISIGKSIEYSCISHTYSCIIFRQPYPNNYSSMIPSEGIGSIPRPAALIEAVKNGLFL